MAVAVWVLFKIILMILLGRVVILQRADFHKGPLAAATLYIRNALDIDSAEQAGLLSGDGATVLTKRDAALILQKVLRYAEKH